MTAMFGELVATSSAVAATRSRSAKAEAIATYLRAVGGTQRTRPDDVAIAAGYLAGTPRQARLDVGWASLRDLEVLPAVTSTLTLAAVDEALEELTTISGPGSKQRRAQILGGLLGRATAEEQTFLRGLVLGELRQGALAGLVVQGIARAAAVREPAVRRALMLAADLGEVAGLALSGGEAALEQVTLRLFRPVQPMLASAAADVAEAVGEGRGHGGAVAVEHKLDGARVQVHRRGEEVRVYTRNLRDATGRAPHVVELVAGLDADSLVLDGEILALGPGGRPIAFQDTMSGFGRSTTASGVELVPFFFDLLHLDGEDLIDAPASARVAALERLVPAANRVPRRVVGDVQGAAEHLAQALAAGHEGIMVKTLDAPYEAGRRGSAWRKVKPVHTLDLVVLAVEWGSGRRRGWLSNLHLGARDPDNPGAFVMLGKTFKGLTDELLEWQTARFLDLETSRTGHVVHVRPEQVVEVAIDGVQTSSRYPGGMALRFARVRRYRDDKVAADADSLAQVRALHEHRAPPAASATD